MSNTILIIHHRPRAQRRACELLESWGYRVKVVSDGEAGVESFRDHRPGLVLIDADLPGKTAPRLGRELRRARRGERAAIFMMTSKPESTRLVPSFDGCLADPVIEHELLAAVRRHFLDGPSAHGARAAPARPAKSVAGDLEHLNIADIVQTLNLGMKTARVTISCGGREGRIWFADGAARHASTDDLDGEAAFYELMRWRSGEFVIEYGRSNGKQTIHQDTMFLVMEGLRRIDEGGGLPANHDLDRRADSSTVESVDDSPSAAAEPFQAGAYATVLLTPRMREEFAEAIASVSQISESPVEPEVSRPRPGASPIPARASRPAARRASAPPPVRRRRSLLWVTLGIGLSLVSAGAYLITHGSSIADPPPPSESGIEVSREAARSDAGGLPALSILVAENDGSHHEPLPRVDSTADVVESPAEQPVERNVETPADDPADRSTKAPAARAPEPAVETRVEPVPHAEETAEPELDLSASIAAADAVLATMAIPEAIEPANVALVATSSVKNGRLILFVDGRKVFSRELLTEGRVGRDPEAFDTRFDIEAGRHDLVVRLELANRTMGYENALEVELEPGEGRTLELIARDSRKRPLLLTWR